MAYGELHGLDQAVLWCALAAALLAALCGWRLQRSDDAGAVLRGSRWTRFFVGLTLLFVGLRMVVVVLLITGHDRVFVEDRLFAETPLLLLPAAALLVLTVPRLWSLARRAKRANGGEPGADAGPVIDAARSLWILVPIQASVLGTALATLDFYWEPGFGTSAVLLGIFIAGTAALWFRRRLTQTGRLHGGVQLGVAAVALTLVAGWFVWAMLDSALPGSYDMMEYGTVDLGGGTALVHAGTHAHSEHDMAGGTSVTDLTGPATGEPDARFTLTAQQAEVELSSGRTIEAWTYNGQIPGPELRVRQGDLVEITLINEDITDGVTIHWHGVDVPNAEDGVAGVTQDAVMPGETYTYRFRVDEVGSHWYHSHQVSSEQVERGLYGALTILPDPPLPTETLDLAVVDHVWPDGVFSDLTTLNASDELEVVPVDAGRDVRLRLINSSSAPRTYALDGVPFQVAAIDGIDLNEPELIEGQTLLLAAGGRYDLSFTMPEATVRLRAGDHDGMLFSADGATDAPDGDDGPVFDPTHYGQPAPAPFSLETDFDREFTMDISQRLGFKDGGFGYYWSINGGIYPEMPMFMVQEGDAVKTTFINRTGDDHPMHLHGHHIQILSRNGEEVSGSPWWTDTLNVEPGEIYEVAFLANNPGIWMDHCHNLQHAEEGFVMHLGYDGVTSPFRVGEEAGNLPE